MKNFILLLAILLTLSSCAKFFTPPYYAISHDMDGNPTLIKFYAPVGTVGSPPTYKKVEGSIKVNGKRSYYEYREIEY